MNTYGDENDQSVVRRWKIGHRSETGSERELLGEDDDEFAENFWGTDHGEGPWRFHWELRPPAEDYARCLTRDSK